MKKSFLRFLSLALMAALVLGLFCGVLPTTVSAATTHNLTDLLAQGKIKPLGRTQVNAAGDGITGDWSGSGFDVNVSGNGGTMTIGYKSSYSSYLGILVDGVQLKYNLLNASTTGTTYSVTIPAGNHTVRVVKESQIHNNESYYWDFTTLAFDGTIEAAPAKKDLFIEFIGDSYTCGDGAAGTYQPGVAWLTSHDSATNGFAYYTAQKLNADYSLVARGGIGLFTGVSAEEGTTQKAGMQDIYNYTSGFNKANGEYGFSRKADVVVIELGANDGTNDTAALDRWDTLINAFVDQVRGKNPDAHIILHSTHPPKYLRILDLVEERAESDPKLHAFFYSFLGNGSAAINTQGAGHPAAEDHMYFADALVAFMRSEDIIPTPVSQSSYVDIPYYVSETGNDSNPGTSADKAKLTLQAAIDQARTDNTFASGSQLVIYVQGTVLASSNNRQRLTEGTVTDVSGEKVPILITTYDYSGTKAVLNTGHAALNDGNGALVFYNDVTLKDIVFQSTTNEETGYRDRNLYAGYNRLVLDNVTFDMTGSTPSNNSGWIVACGSPFGSDPMPTEAVEASVTFKNGDYTNLNFAAAVRGNETSGSASAPLCDFRLYIEDGAHMSTVYNRYGTLTLGSSGVTINGGSVQQYVGTADGSSSSPRAYAGDINLTVNGGHIYGTHFSTAGKFAAIDGNVNTTIKGGIFNITPRDTSSQYDAYFFGGRQGCTVKDINTTIEGGLFYLLFDVAGVDSSYYFGVSGNGTAQNVTNKISGGLFMPIARNATGVDSQIYLGCHTGTITGTLRNEISGGNFILTNCGIGNRSVYAGARGANGSIGNVVNIIGSKGSLHGPVFTNATLRLGGGPTQVGVSSTASAQPAVTDCSDTTVLSNTIYSGNFGTVYLSGTNAPNTGSNHYNFIKGSVTTDIYGGFFQSTLYGAATTPIYGKLTTNIHGGYFRSIYGGATGSAVYDGMELNIYGMDEYYPIVSNSWVICAGYESGSVPKPQTSGRDSIRLTVAPKNPAELTLKTALKTGSASGSVSVDVSGGVFPRGFSVNGKTAAEALASGYAIFDTATGKKASYSSEDASVSGSVAVNKNADTYSAELVYYVSENGWDGNDGSSAAKAKRTLADVFNQILIDNTNSSVFPAGTSVTIYAEGAVDNAINPGGQVIGGDKLLRTSSISNHIPVTITTLNYNGSNKAKIVDNHAAVNGGNASAYVVNDLTFKDIDLQSAVNPATGFCDYNLYAAGCTLTFDNCYISSDNKATQGQKTWNVSADHFSTGGLNPLNESYHPHNGTLVFKNGDYTNLNRVAAVIGNSIYRSAANGGNVTSVPGMHCKVIIGEGAQMGTVYNTFGTMGVGSSTVEMTGGSVAHLYVTSSGNSTTPRVYSTNITTVVSGGTVDEYVGSGNYLTITGDVTHTFSGGTIGGTRYFGLGDNVTLTGNLTNNFTGGNLVINPTSTENGGHGIFLAGRSNVVINGNVTNNITGGQLGVEYKVTNLQSGIYMGLRGGTLNGNLTNNVSGGEIFTRCQNSSIVPAYASIHFGSFSGGIVTGTMTNNVSGGTFEVVKGNYYFGQQGISGSIGRIVNVLGDKATGAGPHFKGSGTVLLAGGWGRVGVTANEATLPAVTDCTDTAVVSNTIYGGTYEGPVVGGLDNTASSYVTYIKGSVQNDIHGGTFSTFYGNGNAPTYGRVITNIHGGTFNAIYGNRSSTVYDGVELNIRGLTEGSNPTGIWAGGVSPTISTRTNGRDAVKLTIDPKDSLVLSMPISAGSSSSGTITGNTTVSVTGGTYTKGLSVKGVTLGDALTQGKIPMDTASKKILFLEGSETTTGTDSVTVVSTAWDESTASLTLSEDKVVLDNNSSSNIPTAKVQFYNTLLTEGVHYTLSYLRDGAETTDFTTFGKVTVVAKAISPFSGTLTAEYTIIGDAEHRVDNLGVLYNVDKTILVSAPNTLSGHYTLLASATKVEDNAFDGCTSLTGLTFGSNVTSLGEKALNGCTGLKFVKFLGDAPAIGSNAFAGVTTTVYYPADNETWANIAGQNYGGTLTWVALEPGASVSITIPGVTGSYSTVQEAIEAYDPETQYLLLTGDLEVDVVLTKDLKIDLNGHSLTGVIDPGEYGIYGVDTSTDNYTCEKIGYFNCVDENGDPIVPQLQFKTDRETYGAIKRYLAIEDENGWSFHRFYFGITHVSLRPSEGGVGYRATFAGDEMVKAALAAEGGFGLQISLDQTFATGATAAFGAADLVPGKAITKRVLLQNIFTKDMGEAELAENAMRPIYARSFIKTADGTLIESTVTQITLRGVLELIDGDYNGLDAARKLLMQQFYNAYASVCEGFELPNLKEAVKG